MSCCVHSQLSTSLAPWARSWATSPRTRRRTRENYGENEWYTVIYSNWFDKPHHLSSSPTSRSAWKGTSKFCSFWPHCSARTRKSSVFRCFVVVLGSTQHKSSWERSQRPPRALAGRRPTVTLTPKNLLDSFRVLRSIRIRHFLCYGNPCHPALRECCFVAKP